MVDFPEDFGAPTAFNFFRDGDLSSPLTVSYTISGTATAGQDYEFLSGPTGGEVTFDSGESWVELVWQPIDDQLAEGSETITVTINPGGGYTPGTPQGHHVSWTVTISDNGNDTIPPNQAPVVANPGAQSDVVGDPVGLAISANDPDGDNLTYSAAGLPPGLSINSASGYISGTISNDAVNGSPYTVTVTASDGAASASQTFQWSITFLSLANPGAQNNLEGDSVSLTLQVRSASGSLTFSASGLPDGLSIDPATGLIAGTIAATADAGSPYTTTVTVSGGTSSASQTFAWYVGQPVAPSLVSPGDQTSAAGDNVSLPLTATDPAGLPLTYSASGLPAGLSINLNTGLISGTIATAAGAGSPYAVIVTASNGTHQANQSFSWDVSEPPSLAFDPPGDQFNAAGDEVALQLWAAAPSGATLIYSATGLPAGLSINPGTGLISGTIADPAASSTPYDVTATVTDGTNTVSQTFQWTVHFVGLVSPGTQRNNSGDAVSLPLQAHGTSGPLTFSAAGLPNGLSIDPATGLISGTIATTAAAGSPYTVTVTASDGTYQASRTFSWYVSPQPTLALDPPGDQFSAAGDAVALQLRAAAPSSATPTYSATGLPAGLSINPGTGLISGTITNAAARATPYQVTATVSDGTTSVSQTFHWAVHFVGFEHPGTQINLDGDVVSLPIVAHDASGRRLTFSASSLPGGLSIDPLTGVIAGTIAATAHISSPYTATVTASDGMYSARLAFQWVVLPPPALILAAPGDQVSAEGDVVSLQLVVTATDPVMYSASGLPAGLSIDPGSGLISGTIAAAAVSDTPYRVTVTASDGTNSVSQTFAWRVTASGAPQMDVPGDVLDTAEPVQFDESKVAEVADEIGNNSYGDLDVDVYRVQLAEGDVLTVTVQIPAGAPPSDPNFGIALRIFDAAGNELAIAGESVGLQPGESIDFTAPADGIYYVAVSYRGNTGYNPFLAASGAAGLTGAYALLLSQLPAQAQKTVDQWKAQARNLLAAWPPKTVTDALKNNIEISKFYALRYNRDPEVFYWFGMAAYASYGAGRGLNDLARANRYVPGLEVFGIPQHEVFAIVATVNHAIFLDMAWVTLAYEGGGMKELERHRASIDPVAYAGWVELDKAIREKDPGKRLELAKKGSVRLVEREQTVLQGVIDLVDKKVVRQLTPVLQTGQPVFPGADWGFGDFGSLEYRLRQIYNVIFPNFLVYQAQSPDNVKKFMANRIAGKLP